MVKPVREIPFFFIVGSARSGTTLLQQMLDAHPNVLVPIESRLILHLKAFFRHEKNWTPEKVDLLLNLLYKERHFKQYWEVEREKLRKNIFDGGTDLSFADVCKIIYLSFDSIYRKEEIQLIGDKNPVYAYFVDEMDEVFPDAKFIHLVRDYHPTVLSNLKAFGEKNLRYYAAQWRLQNEKIEQAKANMPGRFSTLKYEDLVQHPEYWLKKICLFLDIKFVPQMLTFHEQTSAAYTGKTIEGFDRFHTSILKPIDAAKANEWRNKYSEQDLADVEFIAGDFGKRYEYEKVGDKESSAMKCLLARADNEKDYFIQRTYYRMPAFLRKTLNGITTLLYKRLGLKHAYNKHDIETVES